MSLQYHPLLSSWFSLVLFVQLGCDADVGTDTIKKPKSLSVRLFFKLDQSLLQFTVLLAVAEGSSTAKERGQGRTEHRSVRPEKSWKGLVS